MPVPVRHITQVPEFSTRCPTWGVFPVRVRVYLKPPFDQERVSFVHVVKLDSKNSGIHETDEHFKYSDWIWRDALITEEKKSLSSPPSVHSMASESNSARPESPPMTETKMDAMRSEEERKRAEIQAQKENSRKSEMEVTNASRAMRIAEEERKRAEIRAQEENSRTSEMEVRRKRK
jgi:type IV secretory pathway VirB10-like protein